MTVRAIVASLCLSLLLALASGPPAAAQAPTLGVDGLRLVAQVGGASLAGVADGQRIYLGEGPRVVTYRFGEDGHATRLGRSAVLPGVVRDLALHPDGTIAAATGAGGIWLLEAGDSPRVVGGPGTRRQIAHVAWSGSWLVAGAQPSTVLLFEHVDDRLIERESEPTTFGGILDLATTDGGVAMLGVNALTTLRIEPPGILRTVAQMALGGRMRAMVSRDERAVTVGTYVLNLLDFDAEGTARIAQAIPRGGQAVGLTNQSAWLADNDHILRVDAPSSQSLRPLSHGARAAWPIDVIVPTADDRFALAAGRESWGRTIVRRSDTWNAAGLATLARTEDGLVAGPAEDRPGDLVRIVGTRLPVRGGQSEDRRHVVLANDHRAVWAFPEGAGDDSNTRTLGTPYPVVAPGTWSELTDIAVWHDQLFVADGATVHVLDLKASPAPAAQRLKLGPMPREVMHLWAGEGLLGVFYDPGRAQYYRLRDGAPPKRLVDFDLPDGGTWEGLSYFDELAADNDLLIGSKGTWLQIVDISDPERPIPLGDHALSPVAGGSRRGSLIGLGARAVVALDGFLLARSAGTTLEIHDLRDPRAPQLVASIDMPEIIMDVAMSDGHVYAAVIDHGLFRFDLRLPAQPGEAGWLRMRDLGNASGLVVDGDWVFVGGGTSPDPQLTDIVGGWGLVVAQTEKQNDAPSTPTGPRETPGAPEPSPSHTPVDATPEATATERLAPPSATATATRETESYVLSVPWLIRDRAGR
jgi:hypothetical protein